MANIKRVYYSDQRENIIICFNFILHHWYHNLNSPNFMSRMFRIQKKTISYVGFGSIINPKILPMKWHHHHYYKHLSPHPVLTQQYLILPKKIL